MSLNTKEIDIILSETELEGAQIQKVVQSNYNTLCLSLYGRQGLQNLLIVTAPGACRLHITRRAVPKSEAPLRFAELLRSRIINGRIESVRQLGSDRIVIFSVRRESERLILYVRLWSNAANVILFSEDGVIIDAMRRLPGRGETGGARKPEFDSFFEETRAVDNNGGRVYEARELPGDASFNEKIDDWYAQNAESLSLTSLRSEACKFFDGKISKLMTALEKLNEKEKDYSGAQRLKEYGEIILSGLHEIPTGAESAEFQDFFNGGAQIRIMLDGKKSAKENAAAYFERYRKAKNGLESVREAINDTKNDIERQKKRLNELLAEENPLRLQKALKHRESKSAATKKTPGLSFNSGGYLLLVGRSAAENDELLRRHVRGNDLWLHVRDFPGSYVFVKTRGGKSVPLDVLLDAGNLALFYSKGRQAGKGDVYYTPVKYLRRAKNGPRGLVIPTQEKNLSIKQDERRLRELELRRAEAE